MAENIHLSHLISHLTELRKRLIIIAVALIIAFIAAFYFSEKIVLLLKEPIKKYELIFLSPAECFVAHIKLSFFVALFATFPLILYEAWALLPFSNLKKYNVPFVIFSSLFFVSGLAFSYFVLMPFGIAFFLTYKIAGVVPTLTISHYLSFYEWMMLVFGIVFELPMAMVFLTKFGIVRPGMLTRNRKYAVLIIFIVAAILTPPDAVTQVLMAVPLLFLYEAGIIGSKIIYRREKEKSN